MDMVLKIKIHTESTGYVSAEIMEERNPETAKAIINALPIESRVNRWGEEVYFSTSVRQEEERSQEEVEVGEIAYWPPGKGFCIFFGRTPASTGNKPRAASPVNVFGRISGDPKIFGKTRSGEKIRIEKA
jgi:hypothetical protein